MKSQFFVILITIILLFSCNQSSPKQSPIDLKKHNDSLHVEYKRDSLYQLSRKLVIKNKYYYHFASHGLFIEPEHYLYFTSDTVGYEDGNKFYWLFDSKTNLVTIQVLNSTTSPYEYFTLVSGHKVDEIFRLLGNQVISPTNDLRSFWNLHDRYNDFNVALIRMLMDKDGKLSSDLISGSLYIVKDADAQLAEALKKSMDKGIDNLNNQLSMFIDRATYYGKLTANLHYPRVEQDASELSILKNQANTLKVSDASSYSNNNKSMGDLDSRLSQFTFMSKQLDALYLRIDSAVDAH